MKLYLKIFFMVFSMILSQQAKASGSDVEDAPVGAPNFNAPAQDPQVVPVGYVAIPLQGMAVPQVPINPNLIMLQARMEAASQSRAKLLLIPAIGVLGLFIGGLLWLNAEDVLAMQAQNHTASCISFLGHIMCG